MFGSSGYGEAQSTVSQIPGAVGTYYDPYINAGKEAGNALRPQYQNLLGMGTPVQQSYMSWMTNPTQAMNEIGSTYTQSPMYDWELEQETGAMNNAAAAGGMAGTPQHMQESAAMAQGLASQDWWNYMDRALKIMQGGAQGSKSLYERGLSGVEDINKMGYNASQEMAETVAQSLMAAASLQAKAGQSNRGMIGNLIGTAANAALAYMTGGLSVAAKQGAKAASGAMG